MNEISLEVEVMQAVCQAVGRLSDPEAKRRVLTWVNDRFQTATAGPNAPRSVDAADTNLDVDGVADFFNDPAATQVATRDAAGKDAPGAGGIEKLVHGFVTDFQKCALDWHGA